MKTTYIRHPAINLDYSKWSRNAIGRGVCDLENDSASGGSQRYESIQHSETEKRLMTQSDVAFDGRSYWYRKYHYDLLDDALAYARLDLSRPIGTEETDGHRHWQQPDQPTVATAGLMADLGIAFDGKYYRYDDYRYDRFIDAINYAQLINNRFGK